ncbi:MAG: iron-sulfur cluster assembly accessory protein [Chloroflexota bacterium]
MSNTSVIDKTSSITVTPSAAEKVQAMLSEQKLEDYHLRVYVAGMGCSGPQYGLAFDNNTKEDDSIVHTSGLSVVIDPNSLMYLDGAIVDYMETPQGAGFRIYNPNMEAPSCGGCAGSCG